MKKILKNLVMSVLFLGCWATANAVVTVSFSDTTKTPLSTFNSSMTNCENAVNTKLPLSSGTVIDGILNLKLPLSSGTVIDGALNLKLPLSSGTIIDGILNTKVSQSSFDSSMSVIVTNMDSKLPLSSGTVIDNALNLKLPLSSGTVIDGIVNTKVTYDIFYGSMTTIESQKNTIAGNAFVITTASSPATVDSPTAIGNIRWGQDVSDGKWYLYVSTATNSWSRTELKW